jgi:hypothetical protein
LFGIMENKWPHIFAAQNNAHLLSHYSIGWTFRNKITGFSAQGLIVLKSKCWFWAGAVFSLYTQSPFQFRLLARFNSLQL